MTEQDYYCALHNFEITEKKYKSKLETIKEMLKTLEEKRKKLDGCCLINCWFTI